MSGYVGLGQVSPGWCDWVPFADFFAVCQPRSAEQIRAVIQLGPAATPESRAALERATTQNWQAYCNLHPQECRDYTAALDCPTASAFMGPELAAMFGCQTAGPGAPQPEPETPWLLYGALAIVGVAILSLGKR